MVRGQETESGDPVDLFPSNHPLTPPQSTEDRVAWLRLLRSRRVGVTTFYRLMSEHGSAEAALDALPEVARPAGVQDYHVCPLPIVEKELDWAQKCGARMLCYGAPDYPALLADIPDPPPILWAIGNTDLLARPGVGLVGARNASSLGTRMARKLATDLGEAGMVVISGLARGIDTAAHTASLKTGTIAVMAGGVDVIYPSENAVLGEEIGREGLRLSEAPMSLTPQARHFPRRNRIISGLARAVAVVEAAAKSGSLITAEMALEQGREVFAVPGHPFDARASGCNRLIRDGATLLRGARDMLDAMGAEAAPAPAQPVETKAEIVTEPFTGAPAEAIPQAPPETRTLAETAALHQQILDRLGPSPVSEDQLVRDLALPTGTVSSELTDLELDGQIQRAPGGMISRRA
jgi:DNA processing protein